MYHCRIHFYLAGRHCRLFEIIKKAPPLKSFTHSFAESDQPEKTLAAEADVILADLHGADVNEALQTLIAGKRENTELVVLADREQIKFLESEFSEIKDIWTLPMSDEEIRFRFLRWQQNYKLGKDLWQTDHFLESTINNTPNLIWYKDKNGIHEKVNASFCETVNKSREQVEGRGHAYIWDVEHDDPACIESENIVMSSRKTCVAEEIIQTGEGKRLLTTYKSPLYDVDGSVMGTVGIAIDVTQEKAYEQEIINKNKNLETIFTTLDCGIMSHTMDGKNIISINRAALEILGYESQEALEKDGFEMVAPSILDEDKPALREALSALKKEGDNVSIEYRVIHSDGEVLHVMGNAKLVQENGKIFYQRFLLDCTAQKMQEEKQQQRQAELIQALSLDYSLVCFFDLDTGIGMELRSDDNMRSMPDFILTGELSYEDMMDLYIQKFVYEDDQEMLRKAVSRDKLKHELVNNKQYYVNYRTVIHGEIQYYQIKIVRAGVWEDAASGIVLGMRSVDAETRSEMEKKTLLEDALMQANRANKAKSTFLSNMSHDIRTPMNAIVGFTGLAISHIDSKEQVEEYLDKIMTSGNHLLSLINDILDMSRIESGKMHLDEKPCSLPEILHGLRSMIQADINSKQLELYMDAVDIVDEEIYCDKLRLNQVLLNLLSNAVKYTMAGGTIGIKVIERAGASEGYANYEFQITDTGIGMSEEFVSHIFEPFERERTSTISGIQGTGLGMAITKNIVDMMNGSIEVKSELGVGTEVSVMFTFSINAAPKEPQVIPELQNCRALVVDDDFNACDSVSYMLQQFGLRAEWTLSGKEAILRTRQAVMRKDDYSVYIVDWMLPDMNGIEVVRRIRKETDGNVPVIVLTAYDWFDIEKEAKEAGVTTFCSKPLFLSELRNCLKIILDAEEESQALEDKKETLRTGRILLVEDNELNQEIAMAILNDAGFSVDIAENGRVAVDMLKESEPGYYHLVLMDIQMPVMNGYEATGEIRKFEDKKLASIPIIAMTANAFEEDRHEALNRGMNGHIAKPIDVQKLFEMLDTMLA